MVVPRRKATIGVENITFMRLSVLLLLFTAVSAFAQISPQGPQPSYEGQNVSVVALISNPHRDVQPLYAVVSQKAGESYSDAKVQNSIAALQKAGSFPKVQVNVIPEISGLRLNFLLEPAYYVGVVGFAGATQYFSYTRLLQVVNFEDEDPYDPSRIPGAEIALRDLLHRNGYFLAEGHAEPTTDDAHQLVDLKFALTIGKQARIRPVRIDSIDASQST